MLMFSSIAVTKQELESFLASKKAIIDVEKVSTPSHSKMARL